MRKLVLTLICLSILLSDAYSQSFYRRGIDRRLVVYGTAGLSSYFGELTNPGDYFDTKLNFGTGLEYNAYDRFAVRGGVQWFRIGGSDIEADPDFEQGRGARNLSFKSDNLEIMLGGAIYLFSNDASFTKRKIINPYVFGGAALVFFNPKAELDGISHSLRPLKTEGVSYGRTAMAFPLGFGVKLKATNYFDISIEGAYRFTNTDYLDDVSTVYLDSSEYISDLARQLGDRKGELGFTPSKKGNVRGNPESNDGYFIMTAKLAFYIPTSVFSGGGKGSKFKLSSGSMNKGKRYKYKPSKSRTLKKRRK